MEGGRLRRAGSATETRGRSAAAAMAVNWPLLPVLVAAGLAFLWIVHWDLVRLYNLTGSAWDLAYDQQVVWNVSRGNNFYTSFANANFLGIHFEPILALAALVELFWPSPAALLILASAGLAATAPAAYLMIRSLLPENPRSAWLAAALALPLPFWAATQEAARDDFHPENLALALAMLCAWAGLRGHRRLMWVLAVLVLACKEDQVYTIFVAGLLVSAYGPAARRAHGRGLVGLSIGWFVVVTGLVQQAIRHGGYSDFVYYGWLLLHPTVGGVIEALTRVQPWSAVAVIVASMFGLPLLRPRWLLLTGPPLLANMLSQHVPQPYLHLHYALIVMFPLIVAGALGARRFMELTPGARLPGPALAALVAVPALLLGWGNGRLPPSALSDITPYSRPAAYARLEPVVAFVPAGAPVSADDSLTPWFANRLKINDFPDKLTDRCYVVIDRDAFLHGYIHQDLRAAALDDLPYSGRRILYDDGRFVVWSPVGG